MLARVHKQLRLWLPRFFTNGYASSPPPPEGAEKSSDSNILAVFPFDLILLYYDTAVVLF